MESQSTSIIPVSKTLLPDMDELQYYLERIYDQQQTTNNGPLVREFESKLKDYLGVKHLFLTGNATIGLQMAMHILDVKNKEVLTSAFSYVAAPSSILTANAKPRFVDINPGDLCIDAALLEKSINVHTGAIFPTHVFNTTCDVEQISSIASKYGLPIVYDAAHSFGVKLGGESIFNHGDISVCSLHALKVFNSVEGGFLVTSRDDLAEKIYETRYFGANRYNTGFNRVGFNGKNSEVHAAFGLANMAKLPAIFLERAESYNLYRKLLSGLPIQWQIIRSDIHTNHSYLPLLFDSAFTRIKVESALHSENISFRRYFQPALNLLPFFEDNTPMPVSEDVAERILCLPLYYGLSSSQINRVCDVVRKVLLP